MMFLLAKVAGKIEALEWIRQVYGVQMEVMSLFPVVWGATYHYNIS